MWLSNALAKICTLSFNNISHRIGTTLIIAIPNLDALVEQRLPETPKTLPPHRKPNKPQQTSFHKGNTVTGVTLIILVFIYPNILEKKN